MEDSFDRLFSYLRSVGAVTKDEDKADGKKQNKSEKKNRDGNEILSDEQEIISSSPEKSTSGIRLSKDWSQDLLGIYAQFELESLAPSQMANGSRNASRTSSAASLQRIVSKDDSGVTSTSSGEETSSAFAPSSPQSEPALHQDPDVSFHLKQATTLDLPWNIRSDSVQYLGNSNLHRDSTVIQYLLQALSSDPHWRVRQNAAVSLAIVGSKELPKVVEGLKTAFQRDKETKSKAAVALGRLGIRDQEIIATLQRSLRDDNQFDTIKEASEALEQLGITSDSHSPSTSPTPQPIVNRRTMLYGNQRESMRSISIGIKGKYFRSRSLSSGSESDASMGSPRKVDYRIKLQDILSERNSALLFREFLHEHYNNENLSFFLEVETFKILPPHEISAKAQDLFSTYFSKDAELELNVNSKTRSQLEMDMAHPHVDMFNSAQKCIFELMASDCVPNFLQSSLYHHLQETLQGSPIPRTFRSTISRRDTENHLQGYVTRRSISPTSPRFEGN